MNVWPFPQDEKGHEGPRDPRVQREKEVRVETLAQLVPVETVEQLVSQAQQEETDQLDPRDQEAILDRLVHNIFSLSKLG
jgi:hypothetical protein